MEILFLDQDPTLAAQYHADGDLTPRLTDAVKLLSGAARFYRLKAPYELLCKAQMYPQWTRGSKENWMWLARLVIALEAERLHRFPDRGQSEAFRRFDQHINIGQIVHALPARGLTAFPQDLPACFMSSDAVHGHRMAYRNSGVLKFTNREIPAFLL